MNDILSVRDGSIAWRYMRLDAKTGVVTAPAALPTPKDYGGGKGFLEGAMIDGTWSVTTNRRAGNAFTLGKQTANLLAWNEKTVLTAAAAVSRETEANLWPTGFSRREPPVAMALAGNVAIFARLRRGDDGKPAGALSIFSIADGRRLAEFPLDSPPAYDGLAVANGRLFLSLEDGSMMCFAKGE
jgi:hypothetical protein